jgi:hypothetical protein
MLNQFVHAHTLCIAIAHTHTHTQEPDSGAGPFNPEDPEYKVSAQDLQESDQAREAEDSREITPGMELK